MVEAAPAARTLATSMRLPSGSRRYRDMGMGMGMRASGQITGHAEQQRTDGEKNPGDQQGESTADAAEETVIIGVAETEGLQHAPEPVQQMQPQHGKGDQIENARGPMSQHADDTVGQRLIRGGQDKVDKVQPQKGQQGQTAVDHGAGDAGTLPAALGHIGRPLGRAVLQKQHQAGDDVQQEDGDQQELHQAQQRPQGVQVMGITVQGSSTPEDRGIAQGMTEDEDGEHEAGGRHQVLFAQRGGKNHCQTGHSRRSGVLFMDVLV